MTPNETAKTTPVVKVLRAREQKTARARGDGDARARATVTSDALDASVAAREEAYRLARERIFGDDGHGEETATTPQPPQPPQPPTTMTNDGDDASALNARRDGVDAIVGRERGAGGSGMSADAPAFAPKKATRKDRWADSFDPDFIRRDPSAVPGRTIPLNTPGMIPRVMPPMGGMMWQGAAPNYFAPPMPPGPAAASPAVAWTRR